MEAQITNMSILDLGINIQMRGPYNYTVSGLKSIRHTLIINNWGV